MVINDRRVEILFILLASILAAIGYKYFIIPLNLIPGGVSGVASITSQFFNANGLTDPLTFGIFLWVMNIPLYIWSWKKNSLSFTIKSLVFVSLLPLIINILPNETFININENKIFVSLLGAICVSYALVLLYLVGGSGAGLDLILMYYAKKNTRFKIGKIGTIVSWIIVILGTFILSLKFQIKWLNERLLYSLLTMWLVGRFINFFFPRHSIFKISIVTLEIEKSVKLIKKHLPHKAYSIFSLESSRKNPYKKIEILLSYYEAEQLLKKMKLSNIPNFSYKQKVVGIQGGFTSKI